MSTDFNPKRLALLGSTGSIGRQTLQVVAAHPANFSVQLLTAQSNARLLIEQALQFKPRAVVIGDAQQYATVNAALAGTGIEVHAGAAAIAEQVTHPQTGLVLTALVGFAGLLPTYAALQAGKHIALANKETLVVAGQLIMQLAQQQRVSILPVDSEHSAIFQCLVGEESTTVEKLYLTASGGPFRGYSLQQLQQVTKAQALKHPNWSMGAKITIDSATMMNKGLEVIEARWLFNIPDKQIEIVVHPQSIVHSLVQFVDGSLKAQLGLPDMRLPIQYALGYPQRLPNSLPRFDFIQNPTLTFEPVDAEVFRTIHYAYHALEKSGNMPCILNAANEVAVAAFLEQRISFYEIFERLEKALLRMPFLPNPTLPELIETDLQTRAYLQAV